MTDSLGPVGGEGGSAPDGELRRVAELVARREYPLEPRSIAEALLKHIDPVSYWELVRTGDIQY